MVELWLVVSTVCFQIAQYKMVGDMYISVDPKEKCVQQAIISAVRPAPKKGETVYKVMPDGHVAIPSKVWGEVWRKYYWGIPQILKDQAFESIADEAAKTTQEQLCAEGKHYYLHLDGFRKLEKCFFCKTVRGEHGHIWLSFYRSFKCGEISESQYLENEAMSYPQWEERCKICGKPRRKVTEERWEYER